MRLAVLSDIHGNSDALEATLRQAKLLGVDHLAVLGDLVGYYHDARKVIDLLSAWPATIIKGNHEVLLEQARLDSSVLVSIAKKYGSAHATALESLSTNELDWLSALPHPHVEQFGAMRVFLCHGSPENLDQYVYPDSEPSVFEQFKKNNSDIILCGHTHHAFTRVYDNTWILNPGSVGQPRDGGAGAAAWALLDTELRTSRMLRTAYDTSRIIKISNDRDPDHPYLQNVLSRS